MNSRTIPLQIGLVALFFTKPLTSQSICDFDGDGISDLVVGIHAKTISGEDFAGVVQVFYGTSLKASAPLEVIYGIKTRPA